MRNYLKKLNLWQQKRNSLPILDDVQLDWAEMEALLNMEMPQTNDDKRIILLSPPKKINLLSLMLMSFSAAAMTLVVTHVVKTNHRRQSEHHAAHHKIHHRYFDNGDLNTSNDSLVNNNDTVTFDSVELKSYLFINSIETKGDVKLESISDAVLINNIPLPLISFWQQNIDISTQNNFKASIVVDPKNTTPLVNSNKVFDNVPLPLFSSNWLNIGAKKFTNLAVKQLNNTNKISGDSLVSAKTNSVKEHSVIPSGSLELSTNSKPNGNLVKNNINSIASSIKISPLPIAGISGTVAKSKLVPNFGTAINYKKERNLALNKVNKLKNSTNNKVNTVVDTISTAFKPKNRNYDSISSSYLAKAGHILVRNNNGTKNLQKNSKLVSLSKISNNKTNAKATNITNPKIDTIALMAKVENKPDDSIVPIPSIKTTSLIAKNNKNQTNKNVKPTVIVSAPLHSSNGFPVKNLKVNASKTINNPIGQINNTDNSAIDTVIKPKSKAYGASQNKNSKPYNLNKTRNGSNKIKNKIGKTVSMNEDAGALLVGDDAIAVSDVTKNVTNKIAESDLMISHNKTASSINILKLNPVGQPIQQSILNDNKTSEDIVDEDLDIESTTAKSLTLLDYGLLFGLNNPDSFYSYNQGSNTNSAPFISPFFGIFANLSLHNKWSISTQIRFMVPRNSSVAYNFFSQMSTDSAQQTKVTNTRKIYAADFPIHLVYKLNKNISFFAGPTISLPILQINVNNQVQIATIKGGIATYSSYVNYPDHNSLNHIPSFGVSGGGNYQFNRYRLGFMWDKSLTGYQINSNYGTSNSFLSSFQLTFGISLKKPKFK
jgi:hypothetical protein